MEFTVEKRKGKSHGLKAPPKTGSREFKDQFADTIILCQLAKVPANPDGLDHWEDEVISLLRKHTPFEMGDIKLTMREFGFSNWRRVVEFVMDDECIEASLYVARWLKKNKIKPKNKNLGFIDGDGLGFYKRIIDETKVCLEKVFDEKYYHMHSRPEQIISQRYGEEWACIANYSFPSHPQHPAGHGGKFASLALNIKNNFELTSEQLMKVKTFCAVLSHGRTGGFVHIPLSNMASWWLAGWKEEFKGYTN